MVQDEAVSQPAHCASAHVEKMVRFGGDIYGVWRKRRVERSLLLLVESHFVHGSHLYFLSSPFRARVTRVLCEPIRGSGGRMTISGLLPIQTVQLEDMCERMVVFIPIPRCRRRTCRIMLFPGWLRRTTPTDGRVASADRSQRQVRWSKLVSDEGEGERLKNPIDYPDGRSGYYRPYDPIDYPWCPSPGLKGPESPDGGWGCAALARPSASENKMMLLLGGEETVAVVVSRY